MEIVRLAVNLKPPEREVLKMNVVETYVSNITKAEKIKEKWGDYYKLTADTNCYGGKDKQKIFTVSESEYELILEKGYYLT